MLEPDAWERQNARYAFHIQAAARCHSRGGGGGLARHRADPRAAQEEGESSTYRELLGLIGQRRGLPKPG